MSKSEPKASREGRGELEHDSVFDFLYHDSRRIASFLSQFDDNGLLTGLTKGESVGKSAKRAKKIGFGGDVALLGGGKVEFELGPSEGGSESLERVYDPFWANARLFLDVLTDRGMVNRDLSSAPIGQFVLVKGWLSVLDIVMFKEAWKLPSLQRMIRSGMGPTKPNANMTSAQKAAAKEERDQAEMILDLVQIMPHAVHASLLSSDGQGQMLWCSLREEYMVTPASELVLMHGVQLPGEWAILGVMSAHADFAGIEQVNVPADTAPVGLMNSMVGQASNAIAPLVRLALGRPGAASGVTPLLIFREVA